MMLSRFSMGIGDRFGRQGGAQLRALQQAAARGVEVTPVWNKSYREHTIIGTKPADVRTAADAAVKAAGWRGPYFVDADHISMTTVDQFAASSDFFTIDVADLIGRPTETAAVDAFVDAMARFAGTLRIPGVQRPLTVTRESLRAVGLKYLGGIREAGRISRHIAEVKGAGGFVTEVSMDETDTPQTPEELFFILGGLAAEGIPLQTIAPKFTGKFLKGIDYVGDVSAFAREFAEDVAVIAHAVSVFPLPATLKLSVHSGSDKFSLYPAIHAVLQSTGAGLHLKTAGTTWLEEMIGLAAAGGGGLRLAQEVYAGAYARYDELCKPYLAVIDIDRHRLPTPAVVRTWDATIFSSTLRHDPSSPHYSRDVRQLLHVGYKVAAEMGEKFLNMLEEHRTIIGSNVTENLYDRHVRPVFLGG